MTAFITFPRSFMDGGLRFFDTLVNDLLYLFLRHGLGQERLQYLDLRLLFFNEIGSSACLKLDDGLFALS